MKQRLYKKKRVWLGICLLTLGVVVFSRDLVIAKTLELCAGRFLEDKQWTCEQITRQGNRVVFSHIQGPISCGDGKVDRIDICCHLSLFPLSFTPDIRLAGVSVVIKEETPSSSGQEGLHWMGLWASNAFFAPQIHIEEAQLYYPEKDLSFVFGFDSGERGPSCGALWAREKGFSQDFFRARVEKQQEDFAVEVELTKARIACLLPWFSFLPESIYINHPEGQISAKASFLLDPNVRVQSCKADLAIENLQLAGPDLFVKTHALQGTLSFVLQKDLPIWKQFNLFLTFEEGKFLLNQIGFEEALGEFRLHPEEDPYLKMSGVVLSRGLPVPFEIEGKGEILEAGSCWLQAKMDFFLSQRHPQICVSFCQNEKGQSTLQAEYSDLGKETLDLLQGFTSLLKIPEYRMEGGQIQGKLLARFAGKEEVSVEFSECQADNLAIFLPEKDFCFYAQKISMEGLLEQGKIHTLQAQIHKASLSSPSFAIKEITSKLEIAQGVFEPSYIEGSYRGIQLSLQVLPCSSENLLHLEGGAYPEDLESWFGGQPVQGKGTGDPIFLAVDIAEVAGQARFTGTVRFSGTEEDLELEGYFPKNLSRRVCDFLSPWNLASCKGSFSMEKLSLPTALPYLDSSLQNLHPQGSCHLQGTFGPEQLEMRLSSVDLSVTEGQRRFLCALGDVEPVELCYVYDAKQWEAKIPVTSVFMEDKDLALCAEMSESIFFYKCNTLWTDTWKIRSSGAEAIGSLYMKDYKTSIALQRCDGDVAALIIALQKQCPFLEGVPFQGDFSLGKEGCKVVVERLDDEWHVDWSLSAFFYNLSCSLGKSALLHKGQASVFANSEGVFSVKDMEGWLGFSSQTQGSLSCCVQAQDFFWQESKSSDFSLTAREGVREWLSLKGQVAKSAEGVAVHLNPDVHVLGIGLCVDPIRIDAQGTLAPIAATCVVTLEHLPAYLEMGQKIGLVDFKGHLPSLKGDVHVDLFFDPALVQGKIELNSDNFSYEEQFLGKLCARVCNRGSLWKIDSCQVGPYSIKAVAQLKAVEWKVEDFCVESPNLNFVITGSYFPGTAKIFAPSFSYTGQDGNMQFKVKGEFDGSLLEEGRLQGKGLVGACVGIDSASIAAVSVKDMSFYWDSQEGLDIDRSNWQWVSTVDGKKYATAQVQKIRGCLAQKSLVISGCSMQVMKEGAGLLQGFMPEWIDLSKQDLSLQLDVDLSPGYVKGVFACKNGLLTIGKKDFSSFVEVKNMQVLWQDSAFYATCQALWNKVPVWLQVKEREGEAIFIAKEHPDMGGLSCQLLQGSSKKWVMEAVKGEFRGVSACIQRQSSPDKKVNIYDTQIDWDFSKVSTLLPKNSEQIVQKWGLGRGYQCRGVLALEAASSQVLSFAGDVSADRFQCFGKTLQSFRAKVEWTPALAKISGISLEDETGCLGIKTVTLQRDHKMDTWFFTAPLVHVKDFSPSLLVKGKKEGPLIRNISLYDVKGNLKDWKNTTATGLLNFSSLTKKEFSFWDIPLNLIKDLGLDPGLLTPTSGEADVTLAQGRCYFTALRNVCSEGGRSQFELFDPSRDAYLALDGSWHVDLQLKQNVVWKMAEDFVLSIRGSIEKPKYSFTRKDKLP